MAEPKNPFFCLHSAVTIVGEYTDTVLYRPNPKVIGGMEPYVPQLGKDEEVCQFAVEFDRKIIPESHFRAAFKQLENACVERARRAGLII